MRCYVSFREGGQSYHIFSTLGPSDTFVLLLPKDPISSRNWFMYMFCLFNILGANPRPQFFRSSGIQKSFAQCCMPLGSFETALRRIIQYEWTTLAFVSLPSFLAPASVISYLYTSNVWLQPVTYAGRLNLSSWLAISSSGGLSSRILGFALMTVCVCNPVSMSLGKNLMSYLVKRMFRENHMSHRQGNHFTNYMRKIFL